MSCSAGFSTYPDTCQRASTGPTAAQIRIATRRAVNSPNLWATVNICDTTRHPGIVGIRVQMPDGLLDLP